MGSVHPIEVPATGFLDPKLLTRQRELLERSERSRLQGLDAKETVVNLLILLSAVVAGILIVGLIRWFAIFVLFLEVYLVIRVFKFAEEMLLRQRYDLLDRYRQAYATIDKLLGRDEPIFAAGEPQYFEHVVPLLDRAS